MGLATPVVLIVFKRADCTARMIEAVRKARPRRLWVVADGPRADRPGEREQVVEVRRVVEASIDWPCELRRIYSEKNLGCARNVVSGLNAVFREEREAIIVEDDCVPHPSFFRFCAEMLTRYRSETRIAHVGGNNFQPRPSPRTYYFSRYNHIWGWATWRRAWDQYDEKLSDWSAVRNTSWLRDYLGDKGAADYWRSIFDAVASGEIDTWDYQWTYTLWRRDWLAVVPGVNLVENIGFNGSGAHLSSRDKWIARPMQSVVFPLEHPRDLVRDRAADRCTEKLVFSGGLLKRIRTRLRILRRKAWGAASGTRVTEANG